MSHLLARSRTRNRSLVRGARSRHRSRHPIPRGSGANLHLSSDTLANIPTSATEGAGKRKEGKSVVLLSSNRPALETYPQKAVRYCSGSELRATVVSLSRCTSAPRGITTTGTGELRTIFVEFEPRKTLLTGPSRLEPTTSTSPSSQGSESSASSQLRPLTTPASTWTSSGSVASALVCASSAWVRHCSATRRSAL